MEKILEDFWQEKRKADAEYNKSKNKYYEGVSDGMLYCINEIQHSANTPVSGSASDDKCRYCNEEGNLFEGCCPECYRKHCR